MQAPASPPRLPWLEAGQAFPSVEQAWTASDPAPGLLAAGASLDVATLQAAYAQGIFPWYSEGQPILWWSPNPRMVLRTADFKLHRSLRQALDRFLSTAQCEIRIDHDFAAVIAACASTPRAGQGGTWIVAPMQAAYLALHQAGMAHSIEIWMRGQLVGGLYCTALGRAVFGESMFSRVSNASKMALAALVALCRAQSVSMIDCQQNTAHLASLGAREITRQAFCKHLAQATKEAPLTWHEQYLYWHLLDERWGSRAAALASPPPHPPSS